MTARTTQTPDPAAMAQALSAWMDGETLPDGVEEAQLLDWLDSDGAGRMAWQHWHLAGDMLRQSHADELVQTALPVETPAWMAGLQQALAQTRVASMNEEVLAERPGAQEVSPAEPVQPPAVQQAPVPQRIDRFDTGREPANDGIWRWKLAAGFASVAAVALLGWNVLTLQHQNGSMALLAQQTPAPEQPLAQAELPVQAVVADAGSLPETQLEEMLAAHAQVGGQSLLPELTVASLDVR
ncbi:MAG: sigma-E factor negative regulatory protein [Brachymonas denitrificans]|jgi:sigma-E factor negative regulatory protein RseA|uniref:sigma-E factor negative regulatory protein n=1 Tax=Brachymonas denitrificans TaxID=28220 RepID=UPI001BD10131|nr:sigma-E factor negative regulatory protein [Brachymonas denitrificans]